MTLFEFLFCEISNECENYIILFEPVIRFFTAFRIDKKLRSEWTKNCIQNRQKVS